MRQPAGAIEWCGRLSGADVCPPVCGPVSRRSVCRIGRETISRFKAMRNNARIRSTKLTARRNTPRRSSFRASASVFRSTAALPTLFLCCVVISRVEDASAQPRRGGNPASGGFSIVFPIMAPRVSSGYGIRIHPVRKFTRLHRGVDLAAPENSHVRVVAEGRVVFAGDYAGFGKLVTVEHRDGFTSLYGHLAEITVNPGDKIPAGALIGRVGSTGLATGPHLHFEWRRNGVPLDPLKAFPLLAEFADG